MNLRFSLRSLILACTIMAITCGVWHRGNETLKTQHSIDAHGCKSYYSYAMPPFLRHIFGFHFTATLTHVNLGHLQLRPNSLRPQMFPADMSPELFEKLGKLPNLQFVYLYDKSADRTTYNAVKQQLYDVNVVNLSEVTSEPVMPSDYGARFSIRHFLAIALVVWASWCATETLAAWIKNGKMAHSAV